VFVVVECHAPPVSLSMKAGGKIHTVTLGARVERQIVAVESEKLLG
jgi:hypothetical protein